MKLRLHLPEWLHVSVGTVKALRIAEDGTLEIEIEAKLIPMAVPAGIVLKPMDNPLRPDNGGIAHLDIPLRVEPEPPEPSDQ